MNRANGPCDMDISKTCNKFHMVFSVFIWMSPVKCNLTCASPFNRWTISRGITSNQLRQYWACLFCYQHHSALVDIFMASQNNQPFCLEQWNVWPTLWHSLHMPALSERSKNASQLARHHYLSWVGDGCALAMSAIATSENSNIVFCKSSYVQKVNKLTKVRLHVDRLF